MQHPDVVVVGAGIAGGAFAAVLAENGCSVLVLERTLVHEDRVRGEFMHEWGVAEAHKLGLYDGAPSRRGQRPASHDPVQRHPQP